MDGPKPLAAAGGAKNPEPATTKKEPVTAKKKELKRTISTRATKVPDEKVSLTYLIT